ncbi:MAG TPA: biopolymer transporter ExbD [Gemmatimonadaceae bacterium]|nr:biopolymer transporter ExbD [Gemmatimonadaceae bacterium]
MSAHGPRSTPSAEPNVTPMIDVLLVLLIIFMLINVLRQRQLLELQLPSTGTGERSEPALVLEVRPDGDFALNRERVSAGALRARLEAVYAGRPDKVLFVKGDRRVRYQEVIAAVDVARAAGVRVVGVAPSGGGAVP